jgi:hypothetical protein
LNHNSCAERCLPCRPREVKKGGRLPRAQAEAVRQRALQPQPPQPPQPVVPPGQPLLDLVLRQANPKEDAEVYLRCFHKVRCVLAGGMASMHAGKYPR